MQREWREQQQREEEESGRNEHDKRTHARVEGTDGAQEETAHKRVASDRPIRVRQEPMRGYDEVKRRQKRRRPEEVPYVERAAVGYTKVGSKRKAIVMSPVTLTRTVNGRYEWRDAALRKRLKYGGDG